MHAAPTCIRRQYHLNVLRLLSRSDHFACGQPPRAHCSLRPDRIHAIREQQLIAEPRDPEMTEEGVLAAAKEGAISGFYVGATVGAIRAFLYGDAAPTTTTAPAPVTPKQPSPSATSLAKNALRTARQTPLSMLVSTTAAYSGLAAVYLGTGSLAHSVRDKDDMWNSVIGGVVAGSLVGLRTGSLYVSAGAASSLAAVSALYHIFDGQFGPQTDNPVVRRRRAVYQD